MGEHTIKLPDVGEGVAEAELVEWHVQIGDPVREDDVIAAVMTDKATVEIPAPVDGEILWLGAEVGDVVAVGSPLVRIKTAGEAEDAPADEDTQAASGDPMDDGQGEAPIAEGMAEEGEHLPAPPKEEIAPEAGHQEPRRQRAPVVRPAPPRIAGEKPLASPAVRLRAREAGIDLRQVPGTGPAGRIGHEDIDAFVAAGSRGASAAAPMRDTSVTEVKVVGLRRRIAEKMSLAKSRIPHITYVEEVDVTDLEHLRGKLNREKHNEQRPKLTLLPFLVKALVKAVSEQPGINAIFDDEAGIVYRHGGVHVGIATQTPSGLMVPVIRHAETFDLFECSAEIARLADAAREGSARREELSGSTITITSLGAMGGIVTTPVINHPEVAIVGVNKIAMRPHWDGSQFVPRRMMNLSCGFDHRVVDGWDAAVFVQRIKTLLETPTLMFVE